MERPAPHPLDRIISKERADLVYNLRALARDLAEAADRLEARPQDLPQCNGYVGSTSRSRDIDLTASSLYSFMEARRMTADSKESL